MIYVATFPTISDVMHCESCAKKLNLNAKTISLPQFLKAGCGLSFRFDDTDLDSVKNFIDENSIKIEELIKVIEEDGELKRA